MYVIVIGGGKVGYYLARDLLERGDEVLLVEKDAIRADWLTTQLGSIVMNGDGDEMSFLSTTGIERADFVIAATGDDEDNLVISLLAFLGVTALIGTLAFVLGDSKSGRVSDRLDIALKGCHSGLSGFPSPDPFTPTGSFAGGLVVVTAVEARRVGQPLSIHNIEKVPWHKS